MNRALHFTRCFCWAALGLALIHNWTLALSPVWGEAEVLITALGCAATGVLVVDTLVDFVGGLLNERE